MVHPDLLRLSRLALAPPMPRPSIFAVISSSKIGGAERYCAALLKGLAESGTEVSVAYDPAGPMAAEFRAHAARAWPVDLSNIFDIGAVRLLRTLALDSKAALVHTHLWNADVLGALAARLAGIPCLSTVYGSYHLPIGAGGLRSLRRQALSAVFRAAYGLSDRVLALSGSIRDDLTARAGLRVGRAAIDVVYPGLEPVRSIPPRPTAPGSGARIVCVANFFPIKGHESLVRALPRLAGGFPRVRCVFAGDGPERRSMEALATDLGVARFASFVGTVPDPTELIYDSDVLVLPSISEGIPRTILEAWALGVPVVASRAGGIPEMIVHGRSGLLVPPGDSKALAEAVTTVLSDPALARRVVDGGMATLAERFSARRMVEETLAAYRRVLDGSSRP